MISKLRRFSCVKGNAYVSMLKRWFTNGFTAFVLFQGGSLFYCILSLCVTDRLLQNQKGLIFVYKKVDTNLNFVQREKEVEKFWDDNNIFEKVLTAVKRASPMFSMTDLQRLTASRISVTFSLVLSRI